MLFLHYIHGEIKIRLEGNTPERFLNICNANEIEIWDVEYINGKYYFKMYPGDYKRLIGVTRKTSMRPVIVEKQGFPFLMFRYRKHQCFVVGIMLSVFLLYILSLFTWDISFEGNLIYSDDVLMNYLEEIDVAPGMQLKHIDCDNIEKMFRRQFLDITWVSAEISGTRLLIHIKENDEDVINIQDDTPCDLVATKDGIVREIVTRTGTPLVKAGQEVKTGDVLVSSIVNVFDDAGNIVGSSKVHADADILIETVYNYESVLEKAYDYKIYTGKEKELYYMEIMGKLFYIGWQPSYELSQVITSDKQVKLTSNFYLPVHYGKKHYEEYYIDTANYAKNEAENILFGRLSVFLENLSQKGVQILENNVKISENTVAYSYIGEIKVIEPAFTQAEPIEIMEGNGEDEYSREDN